MFRTVCLPIFPVLVSKTCQSQDQIAPTSSPASTSYPFLQLKTPSAVILTGTVERTVGSKHDTGNFVFKAKADGSYSESWDFPSEQTSFTADALQSSARSCSSSDETKCSVVMSMSSCQRSAPWFAPWMAARISLQGFRSIGAASPDTTSSSSNQRPDHSLAPGEHGTSSRKQMLAKAVVADSMLTVSYVRQSAFQHLGLPCPTGAG